MKKKKKKKPGFPDRPVELQLSAQQLHTHNHNMRHVALIEPELISQRITRHTRRIFTNNIVGKSIRWLIIAMRTNTNWRISICTFIVNYLNEKRAKYELIDGNYSGNGHFKYSRLPLLHYVEHEFPIIYYLFVIREWYSTFLLYITIYLMLTN